MNSRPRLRDLGIAPGIYPPGPLNAITDIPGILVGHFTLIEGDDVRTGATAIILPESTEGAPGVTTYFDLIDTWVRELARGFASAQGAGR